MEKLRMQFKRPGMDRDSFRRILRARGIESEHFIARVRFPHGVEEEYTVEIEQKGSALFENDGYRAASGVMAADLCAELRGLSEDINDYVFTVWQCVRRRADWREGRAS